MNDTIRQTQCPDIDQRKVSAQHPAATSRVDVDAEGVWHINGYDEARQILRHEFTKQAGFRAEEIEARISTMKKRPILSILYLEGEEHHRMRRETNKFFTPTVADKNYRDFMEAYATALIERLRKERQMDLHHLAMEMAMRVAAQIVGLTSSALPGLRARLEGMLSVTNAPDSQKTSRFYQIFSQRFLVAFFFLDVKPAIRARRKAPQNDVISYLLTRNYTDLEILTECIVYGVAGMAPTREFISTAVWHFMEKPDLRERMLKGTQEERYAILHEILRLEPIVGHIVRRTTHEITFESEGVIYTIPPHALVDINIFTTNTDPSVTGLSPQAICPGRSLTSAQGKVPDTVMSFGDGYHRCPGAYIAIQEADIFLHKLLALDLLRIEKEPDILYNPTVSGYEVKNFILRVE